MGRTATKEERKKKAKVTVEPENKAEETNVEPWKVIFRDISPLFFNNLTAGSRVFLLDAKYKPHTGDNIWFRERVEDKYTGRGYKAVVAGVGAIDAGFKEKTYQKVYLSRVVRKDADRWTNSDRIILGECICRRE